MYLAQNMCSYFFLRFFLRLAFAILFRFGLTIFILSRKLPLLLLCSPGNGIRGCVPAAIPALYVSIHDCIPSSVLISKPCSAPIITNDLAIPKLAGLLICFLSVFTALSSSIFKQAAAFFRWNSR